MPVDKNFSFESETIRTLYNRHDEMLEGSGNVVVLPPKLAPSSFAVMEDVQCLLENPVLRPHVERRLKDLLSEIALDFIRSRKKH